MDHYDLSVLLAVGAMVGGVIVLRIFFTFWEPFARKVSGDNLDITRDIQIAELKDLRVNVHFRSGRQLPNVTLEGYCSTR